MRALTVRQPWASLIVAGVKPVENRTWPYRMPRDFPHRLAIHAGARPDLSDRARPAWQGLAVRGIWRQGMAFGALIGTVQVTGCHHADDCRWYERAVHDDGRRSAHLHGVHHCSPWAEPNAWHWTFADPVALDEPIPCKGRQGLWTVPDDVLAEVVA